RVVDARGGFIEDQQFGSRCQCTSYEHALLLSARKLSQTRMATISHVDAFERLTRGAPVRRACPTHDGTPSQCTAQRDFGHRGRHTRYRRRPLRDVSDTGPLIEPGYGHTEHVDAARGNGYQAHARPHERRFSRTVSAEQCDEFSGRHVNVDIAQDGSAIEAHIECINVKDVVHVHPFALWRAERFFRMRSI